MTGKIVNIVITLTVILSVSGLLGYIYYADVTAMSGIEIKLNDVDLTDVKLSSFKLKLHTSIYNPTDQDISELSSAFNIYIEDNFVGKGSFSKTFISAHSQIEKDISITIFYSGLADATIDVIIEIIKEGNFDLIISGNISGNVLFNLIEFSQEFEATYIYS